MPMRRPDVSTSEAEREMFGRINKSPPPSAGPSVQDPRGKDGIFAEPVPFGGYDAPGDEYRRGFEQMIKQLGAERVRQMPQDQLMQMLQLYGHGGPMR